MQQRKQQSGYIYIETCVEYGDIVDVFSINFPCCALTTSPHLTQEVSYLTREGFLSSSRGFFFLPHKRGPHTRGFLPHKRGLSSSQERAWGFLWKERPSLFFFLLLYLSHVHPSRRSRTQAYTTDVSMSLFFRVCQ